MLEQQNFSGIVCRELGLLTTRPELEDWEAMVQRIRSRSGAVTVGLVGKYVQLHDAYLSVAEALRHVGYDLGLEVELRWIDSEGLCLANYEMVLEGLEGILVPGGFGGRGVEGMILAAPPPLPGLPPGRQRAQGMTLYFCSSLW